MGIFPPVYPDNDLNSLSDKKRQTLRNAVLRQLQTSPEIRRILKRKTQALFNQLAPRKSKARKRRK